jgi:hypothetical protein
VDVVDIYNLVAGATKLQEAPNQEQLEKEFKGFENMSSTNSIPENTGG